MADLMELLRQKRNAMTKNKRTIKPAAGRNRYRILPTWRTTGDPVFYHDFGQHFVKDQTNVLKAVYMCVDKTFGRSCAVCDQIARGIMASTDDVTTKTLQGAAASHRILMNVLELDGDTPGEPQVLEVSPTVFKGVLDLIEEWGVDMLDPEKGTDIIVTRDGAGLLTKYTVQVASKSQPVPATAMKKLTNLDEFVAQESEEVSRKALGAVNSVAGLIGSSPSMAPTDRPTTPTNSAWGELIENGDDDLRSIEAAKPVAGSVVAEADDIDAILAGLDS